MPLILAPSFDDKTRQEIEQHIAEVQERRMVAALEYHAGKNIKLTHESESIQRRVAQQYELLGKDILRADALDEKIQDRLTKIETLRQELGFVTEQLEGLKVMPQLDFNGFQRELVKREIPNNVAYMLTLVYEQLVEVAKQTDIAAKTMLSMAETMGNIVELNGRTKLMVENLEKFGKTEGIDVRSESVLDKPQ